MNTLTLSPETTINALLAEYRQLEAFKTECETAERDFEELTSAEQDKLLAHDEYHKQPLTLLR